MRLKTMIAAGLLGLTTIAGAARGQGELLKVETMGPPSDGFDATPALWKVQGVRGTVYLFGTVHVMKKDVRWETPIIAAALKSSGTLWLEISDVSDAAMKAMQPLILRLGVDVAHPLSTKLTKEDVAALDTAVKGMGYPGEAAVEPLQPWVVYLLLSALPLQAAGYEATSGIDRALQTEAAAAGKPVKGFETTEEQLHSLSDLPQADQVEMLHEELKDLPNGVRKTHEMVDDWERGDMEKIAAMEDDEMRQKEPGLYAKLLVNRNLRIADKLANILKDPATGTVFAAIGAAHLAGPDSVLKMLEKQGFVAARVQ